MADGGCRRRRGPSAPLRAAARRRRRRRGSRGVRVMSFMLVPCLGDRSHRAGAVAAMDGRLRLLRPMAHGSPSGAAKPFRHRAGSSSGIGRPRRVFPRSSRPFHSAAASGPGFPPAAAPIRRPTSSAGRVGRACGHSRGRRAGRGRPSGAGRHAWSGDPTASSRTKQPRTRPSTISRDLPTSGVILSAGIRARGGCLGETRAALHACRAPPSAPAIAISSTSGGNGTAQVFIASSMASSTMLTVNSLRHADVVAGVLEAHVGMVLDPDGDDGRVGREAVEEAERGRVAPAHLVHRGDEGDRPRMTVPIRSL